MQNARLDEAQAGIKIAGEILGRVCFWPYIGPVVGAEPSL